MSVRGPVLIAALACACVVATGCRDTSAPPVPQLDGSFALTMINHHTLPDTLVMLPPSGISVVPTCKLLATSGSLTLDPVTSQFTIAVNATSACSRVESPLFTEVGTYTQDGETLTLTDPYPGQADNLTGHIDDGIIIVEGTRYDYGFAR